MSSRFWIPKKLPGFNELIGKALVKDGGPHLYQELKQSAERFVSVHAMKGRFEANFGCWTYLFIEPNKKRDPSNVISGGIKVIEDALRRTPGTRMRSDGWRDVQAIRSYFTTSTKVNGVMVWCTDEPLTETDAVNQAMELIDGRPRNPTLRDVIPLGDETEA